MPAYIFTRNTWWLYADVPSSSAVVLQQQWIHFRGSTGKTVTCWGAQRVGVFKWKIWGMIPPSWVPVLTPCQGGTQQYPLAPTLGAPKVSCVPRLVSWEVAIVRVQDSWFNSLSLGPPLEKKIQQEKKRHSQFGLWSCFHKQLKEFAWEQATIPLLSLVKIQENRYTKWKRWEQLALLYSLSELNLDQLKCLLFLSCLKIKCQCLHILPSFRQKMLIVFEPLGYYL